MSGLQFRVRCQNPGCEELHHLAAPAYPNGEMENISDSDFSKNVQYALDDAMAEAGWIDGYCTNDGCQKLQKEEAREEAHAYDGGEF